MRVLLINPKDGDLIRAHNVLKRYMADHYAGTATRARHQFVCYSNERNKHASVWHSKNQITIHFGEDEP